MVKFKLSSSSSSSSLSSSSWSSWSSSWSCFSSSAMGPPKNRTSGEWPKNHTWWRRLHPGRATPKRYIDISTQKHVQDGPLPVINGFITLVIGVITQVISGRGPPCRSKNI